MKNLSLLLLAVSIHVCASRVHAQEAVIQWQKCFGGTGFDEAQCIQQTTDGSYIAAGYSNSTDGDILEYYGGKDIWITKTNNSGNIIWQKVFGGDHDDLAVKIEQTADGGYIAAGHTGSHSGFFTDNHGLNGYIDYLIIKLDQNGDLEWKKCLGGSSDDYAYSIQITPDGGYIIAGETGSNNGDVSGNHVGTGGYDAWVVKLDDSGNIEWQKCLGGSGWDAAYYIENTSDGGYIVAGYTWSNDGDVAENHGNTDAWIVKLNNTGNIEWQKCFGGSGLDYFYSIQQTTDAGYVVISNTDSNDGDVIGNHGDDDVWVLKLDNLGDIQWQKCMGGTDCDFAESIQPTNDGGFIVGGATFSNNGDVSDNHSPIYSTDAWIVKLDFAGNIEWQKCVGGGAGDIARCIHKTYDGGYCLAGYTESNSGDVYGNHGNSDFWIVKLIESNVSGLVFHDTNLNGIPDEGEQGIAGHLIKQEPGPFYTFTNNQGKYFFKAETGEHTVSYVPVNYWYATAEEDYQFSVISYDQIIDTLDFGIATRENSPDVAVYLTGSPTRVGFDTHYWITYKNQGTLTTSGTVNVAFDPLLTFVSSTETPASQSGNVFTWNYGPMGPGVEHQFRIDFQVPGIEHLGDTLFSHAWITPFDPDTCPANNYDTIYQEITGSYDPNDKRVSPAGIGDEGYVLHGQRLSYTIRFQNTGNDTAFTVLVRDTLDVTNMDIETINIETYSHPVSWQFKNPNVMEFRFNNILLPDSTVNEPGSHGFVRFSVSPKPGMPDYTVVENTAHIYFDYNPAVVTNTTVNTYVTNIPTGINGQTSSDLIAHIYPNPASDKLNIAFTGAGSKSISMTNLLGQSVYRSETSEKQLSIDLSHFDKGMYFIVVSNNKQKSQVKVVIE